MIQGDEKISREAATLLLLATMLQHPYARQFLPL